MRPDALQQSGKASEPSYGWGLSFLLYGSPTESELGLRILLELTELLDCDAAGLHWLDPQLGFPDQLCVRDELCPVADADTAPDWFSGGGPWRVSTGAWHPSELDLALRCAFEHELRGPLNAGSRTWATIVLVRREHMPAFDDRERSLFRGFCLSLSLLIENRLMQTLLGREVEALHRLAESSERWHESRDPGLLLSAALDQALDFTHFSHGLAFLDDEGSGELRPVSGRSMGDADLQTLVDRPLSPYRHRGLLKAIAQGSLAVADLDACPELAACFPQPCKSFACLPLTDGGHFEGALILGDRRPMGHAASRMLQAAGPVLAGQVARAIRNNKLFRSLATKSRDLERATEELTQAERRATLVKLAAAVAHQIRNPLSVVSAHVELIRDAMEEEDPRRETLQLVSNKVTEANGTVQQLLELSRPLDVQMKLAPLPPALTAFLRFIEPKCRHQGVELNFFAPEGIGSVWMDETHLQRCLLDLSLNALQLLGTDGRLDIQAEAQGAWVRVSVTDNGPGISPELQSSLFEPFVSGRSGGTGMGLYNVKRVCQEMGAVVLAGSMNGAGARFNVYLRGPEVGPFPTLARSED